MTTKEALIIAGNVVLAAVGVALFIEGKLPTEQLALVLVSIGFPSAGALLKREPDGPGLMLFVAGSFAVASVVAACGAADRQQVRDGITFVDSSCRFVEAITDDGTAKSICATVDELAEVAHLLALEHAEAGAPRGRSAKCVVLPTTTYCATNAETAKGIDAILRQRAAWFSLDAGGRK